jgi:hypothetical protein
MYSNNVYKGRYKVNNPKKYTGNPTNVIYRSMWEFKFMKYCDNNPNVLEWGSEEVVIPYLSPVDGKVHRYFVDFYMKVQESTGHIRKYLIEIKPAKFTQPPTVPKRRTQQFVQEVYTWGVNQAKWKAARDFCENRGWNFEIITEKELGIDK